jgi:hypothetical protein
LTVASQHRLGSTLKGILTWFGFALGVSIFMLLAQALYGWLVPIIFGVGRGNWVVGGEYHAGWRFIAGAFTSLGGFVEMLLAVFLALGVEKAVVDPWRWPTALQVLFRIVTLALGLAPKVLAYWVATVLSWPTSLPPLDPNGEMMWGYFVFSGFLALFYVLLGEDALEGLFKVR